MIRVTMAGREFNDAPDLWEAEDGKLYRLVVMTLSAGSSPKTPSYTTNQFFSRFPSAAPRGSRYMAIMAPIDLTVEVESRLNQKTIDRYVDAGVGKGFMDGPFELDVSGPATRAERPARKSPPTGPKGPKGTDPTGGTPAAGRVHEPELLEAVA